MNTGRTTNQQSNPGPHLSDETLSEYASGTLREGERVAAEQHAETCAQCAEALRDYAVMTTALKNLPAPRLKRNFQLSEEQARSKARRWSFPSLVPSLPALRAATLAVALLLVGVAGADHLSAPSDNTPTREPVVAFVAPTVVASEQASQSTSVGAAAIAPTEAGEGSGQVDAGDAVTDQTTSASADQVTTAGSVDIVGAQAPAAAASNSETADAAGGSGSSGSDAGNTVAETSSASSKAAIVGAFASPETTIAPEPIPTEPATPDATPPATPTPEPTEVPAAVASTSGSSSSRTGWRIAELGLGLLLLWLIVSYAGALRTPKRER